MNPIWAAVECTRRPLTSGRVVIAEPAMTTVSPPAIPTMIGVVQAPSGASRSSRSAPAFTNPACRIADTGVGAASVAGSHP